MDKNQTAGDWLSKEELQSLTPEIMAERVKAIVPLAAARAQEAERLRKPHDEVWNALRKSGIFYHFVPKKFGGLEWSVEDFVRIMLPLGAGCASTAWVATFCMEHNWILARYSEALQREIFAKFPYIIAPGVIFPPATLERVPGGFRASGRLRWGTGVMHADWVIANGALPGKDGEKPRLFSLILPVEDVKVVDIWHVDGAAATGTNDVLLENVFIPESHTMESFIADDAAPGHAINDSAVYHAPKIPFLALTAAIAPVGAALGAVNFFRDYMKERLQRMSASSHAERPAVQMRLGRAQIMTQTAEGLLFNAARRMTAIAERGPRNGASIEERMNLRMELAYAVELSRKAVDELREAAGTTAHYLDNPLQRYARDLSVMATHLVFDYDIMAEQNGRVVLGMKPTMPIL